jgi:hypothetical protein
MGQRLLLAILVIVGFSASPQRADAWPRLTRAGKKSDGAKKRGSGKRDTKKFDSKKRASSLKRLWRRKLAGGKARGKRLIRGARNLLARGRNLRQNAARLLRSKRVRKISLGSLGSHSALDGLHDGKKGSAGKWVRHLRDNYDPARSEGDPIRLVLYKERGAVRGYVSAGQHRVLALMSRNGGDMDIGTLLRQAPGTQVEWVDTSVLKGKDMQEILLGDDRAAVEAHLAKSFTDKFPTMREHLRSKTISSQLAD